LEWSQPASAGPFGAILYPFEVALGRMRSEGPSTHILVCRKAV